MFAEKSVELAGMMLETMRERWSNISIATRASSSSTSSSPSSSSCRSCPRANPFDVLLWLLDLLLLVSLNKEKNKMNQENLAIVLAPNLYLPLMAGLDTDGNSNGYPRQDVFSGTRSNMGAGLSRRNNDRSSPLSSLPSSSFSSRPSPPASAPSSPMAYLSPHLRTFHNQIQILTFTSKLSSFVRKLLMFREQQVGPQLGALMKQNSRQGQ